MCPNPILHPTKTHNHITPISAALEWLPRFRIDFKILPLVLKALNVLAPDYLICQLPMCLTAAEGSVLLMVPDLSS